MQSIGLYAKAVSAAVVAVLTAYITALSDGVVTEVEWTVVATAGVASTAAVWAIPNVPAVLRTYGKAGAAGLLAGLASLGVGYTDAVLTQPELLTAVVALITGSGLVAAVPNAFASDPPLTDEPEDGWEPEPEVGEEEDDPDAETEPTDEEEVAGDPETQDEPAEGEPTEPEFEDIDTESGEDTEAVSRHA